MKNLFCFFLLNLILLMPCLQLERTALALAHLEVSGAHTHEAVRCCKMGHLQIVQKKAWEVAMTTPKDQNEPATVPKVQEECGPSEGAERV